MDEMGQTAEELLRRMLGVAETKSLDAKRTVTLKFSKLTLRMWIDRARRALGEVGT